MTITAKIIADSISKQSPRLITFQLRYPKFVHGEFMTHRDFSRNASSSRAIPVKRLIQDVMDDPAIPIHWGANKKGMQADKECDVDISWIERWGSGNKRILMSNKEAWLEARDRAIEIATAFDEAGYHKQIVNRLLEPFCHINVVCTATRYSNFFALRRHKDAQPEIRVLADSMFEAMEKSTPQMLKHGQWHLPYIKHLSASSSMPPLDVKVSVARCARVSYLTQEGKEPSIEEDLRLYDRLVGSVPLHASPAEHQATPDTRIRSKFDSEWGGWQYPELHGNLTGYIQHRKQLKGECQ